MMTMTMHTERQRTTLHIEGEMTIYRAAELKRELLAALDQASTLELDLSKVTDIDGAGIQLLILAMRTAREQGVALHTVDHSAAVREVFALLGFSDPACPAADIDAF